MSNDSTDKKREESRSDQTAAPDNPSRERALVRSLIDSIPDLIFHKDEKFIFRGCNHAFEKRCGLSEKEIVGRTVFDLFPPETAAAYQQSDQEMISSKNAVETEELVTHEDGRQQYFATVKAPITSPEGQSLGLIGIARDITERKQAEAALKLSHHALENMHDALFWLKPDGRYFNVNEAACRLLGYDRETLLTRSAQDHNPNHPPEAWPAHWEELRRKKELVFETELLHKDGSLIPVEIAANFLSYEGKEYNLAFVRDVTDRKRAEEELNRLNRTLEARVKEEVAKNRTKELLLVQQSRSAAMGEMIGSIAHQWRQPINALSLLLANLKDALAFGELTPDFMESQTRKGVRIIQRMSNTIDDFRNYFRPDKRREIFDAAEATQSSLSLLDASFAHNGIVLDAPPPAEMLRISGYPGEFSQVILLILGNAKDAIEERKVKNGRVTVRCLQEGEDVVVAVHDNGGGIPGEIVDRIFDPYFTTKEADRGTGIGLYMAKVIIEEHHHGRIEVVNLEDGATFRIAVPRAEE